MQKLNTLAIEIVDIKKVIANPSNPRVIRDDKFLKLVKSIQEFPQMLEIRPIVVNEDMVVLGGNMRLKACKEAGLKKIPIIIATNITETQQKEFIIKDNVGFGEWDWEILANEWDNELLNEWGLEVWSNTDDVDIDNFFEENGDDEEKHSYKIVLEYTQEEYEEVIACFEKYSGSKEDIIYKLLTK